MMRSYMWTADPGARRPGEAPGFRDDHGPAGVRLAVPARITPDPATAARLREARARSGRWPV